MSEFSEIAIASFSDAIKKYELKIHVESSNEVIFVKEQCYVLQITKAPNGEIDFTYYVMSDEKIFCYYPMWFIGVKRAEKIPRAELNQSPKSFVDEINNYERIFSVAGSDILLGDKTWLGEYGLSAGKVSSSVAPFFSSLLGASVTEPRNVTE